MAFWVNKYLFFPKCWVNIWVNILNAWKKNVFDFFFAESTQLCELRRIRMVLGWFVNIFVEQFEGRFWMFPKKSQSYVTFWVNTYFMFSQNVDSKHDYTIITHRHYNILHNIMTMIIYIYTVLYICIVIICFVIFMFYAVVFRWS